MSSYLQLVDNTLDLPAYEKFTAILGANPSRGARSPKLWGAAFKAHRLSTTMFPMDVSANNLLNLLVALNNDPKFLGGAVAVPHKETVANWLGDCITEVAANIGAVNCLFRSRGRLWGTNTDGEAAVNYLERRVGDLEKKKIVLIGVGGAGKAVAANLIGRASRVILSGRRTEHTMRYAQKIGAVAIPWDRLNAALLQADILINCTSCGSAALNLAHQSPLNADQLDLLPASTIVFDIIYDPNITPLMKMAEDRGLAVLNGEEMNFEQAMIAFGHVMPQLDDITTRIAMSSSRKRP